MSYIPSHAMPHTYVHEDEDEAARKRKAGDERPSVLMIAGGALLGYLLFRALR